MMEHTGRYYEVLAHKLSEAQIFSSMPLTQNLSRILIMIPFAKSNPIKLADKRLPRYALDKWQNLKRYNVMDELRNQLKTMNRQFGFYMKHKTAMKNNLIGIPWTKPILVLILTLAVLHRSDGSQKWVDFASTYWHVDCVRKMSLNAFIDHYQSWLQT